MTKDEKKFFTMSVDDVIKSLDSSKNGLSTEEAQARLKEYGYNKLEEKGKKSLLAKFIDQFKNLMIIVLLVLLVVSMALLLYFIQTIYKFNSSLI